jgi:hypothetical protein
MMLNEPPLYVVLILVVTLAQLTWLRTCVEPCVDEPVAAIIAPEQHHRRTHHLSRSILEAPAFESKAGNDSGRQDWTWDEIDSEKVEERKKPFQDEHLQEDKATVTSATTTRFGVSKHRKHHRHDIHLHLPKLSHNRSGEPTTLCYNRYMHDSRDCAAVALRCGHGKSYSWTRQQSAAPPRAAAGAVAHSRHQMVSALLIR